MKGLSIPVLHGATGNTPDERDTVRTALAVRDALVSLGGQSWLVTLDQGADSLDTLAAEQPDLVFNLVEAIDGLAGPAAAIPKALARRDLPFTGCGAEASWVCRSKVAQKVRMRSAGLPTPAWSQNGASLARAPKVIVKSITEHASIGIEQSSVMSGRRAVQFIADRMAQTGDPHFAEAFVDGREFALSLLETDDDLRVLPPAETLFVGYGDDVHHIVDYDAKWVEDSHGYQNTPRRFDFPEADDALLEELQRLARACWDLFGLSGYARIDFRVDDTGQPWILEVNTNPCLAPDAGFMAAAAEAGLTFEAVIAKIVSAGLRTTKKAA
ncbi:D-alanine--D-alanine ligase family protein [Pseudaestuariivita atlantica]|uniref:D-alanine--D-alanine ligase family protein n=1 Tax=Pseudaestuariivita atlantica TaxID=1317121 RepID=UPI0009E3B7AA|nr:hypothetical protein [Pseudaestuariivita atlantica]